MVMKRELLFALLVIALLPSVNAQGKVLVLTSDNPADNAVATIWAQKLGASLVVTPWGSLTPEAVNKVVFSGAGIVYVVGGTAAVPNAEDALKVQGISMIRVGGENRQETSLKVAERIGATKVVVLDGYDAIGMESAVTIGSAEGLPIVFLRMGDVNGGKTLQNARITDVTLIPNPAFDDALRDSIKKAGIKVTELSREGRNAAEDAINNAEANINRTAQLVRPIKDGSTLAAARLLVESRISIAKAEAAFKAGDYKEAYTQSVFAAESIGYAIAIYNGRYPGRILEMVSQASADISRIGLSMAKENLQKEGMPYGVGLPMPPVITLDLYMVDVAGYQKTQVASGIEYDMGAKYTKKLGQTVAVELYKRSSDSEAIKWVEQVKFTSEFESRDWILTSFMGYPASMKTVNYTISNEKRNQEVYLRVAIGNLGVFTRFTESVSIYSTLTPREEARLMVEEITRAIVKAIEESS